MGFKVFYGDATRIDILKAAGADKARILIAAIGTPGINHDLIEKAKKLFPNLTIMARAENRFDAYDLMDKGVTDIYRETLDTSVRLGIDCLVKLGHRQHSAYRAGQNFIRYDEAALQKLAQHRHDQGRYIFNATEQIRLQEELLANDRAANPSLHDHAWDSSRQDRPPEGEPGK
jgi:CPA2 family monovalent cation:H+ antiporter-2